MMILCFRNKDQSLHYHITRDHGDMQSRWQNDNITTVEKPHDCELENLTLEVALAENDNLAEEGSSGLNAGKN